MPAMTRPALPAAAGDAAGPPLKSHRMPLKRVWSEGQGVRPFAGRDRENAKMPRWAGSGLPWPGQVGIIGVLEIARVHNLGPRPMHRRVAWVHAFWEEPR
jgi:hypothetical protein